MNNIPEQKYKPNQWLKYEYGSGQAVSKVVGAVYFKGKGWTYTLVNPADQSGTVMVLESKVIQEVESA